MIALVDAQHLEILVLERGRRRPYPELVRMRFDIRKLGDLTFARKGKKR